MKPVTDPNILSQLNKPVTDPALLSQLNAAPAPAAPPRKTRAEIQAETEADTARMADPSAGMNWAEKGLVGIGAGFSNVGRGVRSLANKAGLLDEEAQAELKRDQEDRATYEKHHPGGWATAGEVVGEGLATLPVGGVIGSGARIGTAAGSVLTKAVPALAKAAPAAAKAGSALSSLGKVGGGVVGAAGRGAAEGAISNVITGPEDQSILEKGLTGAAFGGGVNALGHQLTKAPGRELTKLFQGKEARGRGMLEKSLGGEKAMSDVADQIRTAPRGGLPQTTAALTGNAKLGALERGARSRGTSDFVAHDKAVDKAAWDQLHKITEVPGGVANLQGQPSSIYAEGQAILDRLPLSQKNRGNLSMDVAALRANNEVIGGDPAIRREIDRVLHAVSDDNATLGVLPQLYTSLDATAAGSPTIREVKRIIREYADDRSKGQFSNVLQGYGATKDAVRAAETAQGLRGVYKGSAGIGEVPPMKAKPLQAGLEKGINDLDPDVANKVGQLTSGLRKREIYKTPGATDFDTSSNKGILSVAGDVIMPWRALRAANTVQKMMRGLDGPAAAKADEALLDPQKFLKMVDAKKARKAALAPWEKGLDEAIRGAARSASMQDEEAPDAP